MLDANTLSQLASLKTEIGGDKPLLTGVVQGSAGRFGFVVTDDNERHFLPPDEMKRVLPGDRIEFSVTDVEGKSQAAVESLVHSEFGNFVGKVVATGKNKLVAPDYPGLTRWLALTHKAAETAIEGQWVAACLKRHPVADGRALVDVTRVLGDDSTPFIEHTITKARFGLVSEFSAAVQTAAESLDYEGVLAAQSDYEDALAIPFVTIDSASTKDMDDAFALIDHGDQWTLHVAIADPSLYIEAQSVLDQAAKTRASSRYLPGETLHMLPSELSVEHCSLQPDTVRPALLLQVSINKTTAEATSPRFSFGRIRSRAKLSYESVAALLAGATSTEIPTELQPQLHQLAELTQALSQYRQHHCMVMPDRPDYRLQINEHGHIDSVVEENRTSANQMVEEIMLLTNHLAARYLADHQQGLFLCHDGFRPDQLDAVKALLDATLCQKAPVERAQLADFAATLPLLQRASEFAELPLQQMLPKFFRRTELSLEPRPHWGLGFPVYTTVTSPIRKYLDLFLHRQIKALWRNQQSVPALSDAELTQLQTDQGALRAPANFLEQWLKAIYLKPQEGTVFEGEIQHVTANGFAVQLAGLGTSGFVNIKGWRDKTATFDPVLQLHTTSKGAFRLTQKIRVVLTGVDLDRRNIQLDVHTAT